MTLVNKIRKKTCHHIFYFISGAPYAGASAQRMGSASLRKYSPTHNIRGNGTITNKSVSLACCLNIYKMIIVT